MNAKALYVATSGNPFFVTEVLASGGIGVPTTVRDAILARVEGLADTTRRSLELLSVIPGHAKRGLAEQLLEERAGLEEAERRGFLVADEPGSIEKQ